jgi:hypothetical protein
VVTRALCANFQGCHQSLGEDVVAQHGGRNRRSEIWPVFTLDETASVATRVESVVLEVTKMQDLQDYRPFLYTLVSG